MTTGNAAAANLPEPQLLQVKRPGGKKEDRVVRLDAAGGILKLRSPQGPEMGVDVSQFEAIGTSGNQIKLASADGEEVLRLFCESPEDVKAWLQGFHEVARLHGEAGGASRSGSRRGDTNTAAPGTAGRADDVRSLKELCQCQEERVAQLESLNRRKDEQLLKLSTRLEQALMVLQTGQATYAEQQKVLEAQQSRVEALRERQQAQAAGSSGAVPVTAAAASTRAARGGSGGAATSRLVSSQAAAQEAEADGATDTESDGAPLDADTDADTEAEDAYGEMAELARHADRLQDQLDSLRATPASARAATAPGSLESQVSSANQVASSAPQILAHLQSLIAEKDRLEAQLRGEQADLEQQLIHLYAQRGSAPLLEEEEGEDTSP